MAFGIQPNLFQRFVRLTVNHEKVLVLSETFRKEDHDIGVDPCGHTKRNGQ